SRLVDSPPASAALSPNSPLPGLAASAAAKTHPAPIAATTRRPTSSCRTSAADAIPARSTSPARYPRHRQELPDLPGTASCLRSVVRSRRKPPAACAKLLVVGH